VNSFTVVTTVLSPINLLAPSEFGNHNPRDVLSYCHICANDIWKISESMSQASKMLHK